MPPVVTVPTIDLPQRFSAQSLPPLLRHLEQLAQFGPEAIETEVDLLAQVVSGWHGAAQATLAEEEEKDSPNEERLERLQDQTELLDQLNDALGHRDLETAREVLRSL